jgi:hypothetical protein
MPNVPDERLLLLARDPVAAWRAHAASSPWSAPRRGASVFVASRRAHATFGVAGTVTTLDRWARTPPTVVATPLARRRALQAAVAAEPGPGHGSAPPSPDDAAGLAVVAGPAVRELLRAADLDGPPFALEPRLERWWRVAVRYRALLAEAGVVDPAEALRSAAARAAAAFPAARPPVALLGHLDLAADEVEAIDALAGPGSVIVLPYDPPWTDANALARAALRARGWREEVVATAAPWPEVEALAPPTLQAEARWAVAEAKRLLAAGHAPAEVVLAARDVGAYAAAVTAAARAAGTMLRIDRSLPLAATATGAPVMAWLEAVAQRGAFEPTLAWLAHPRVARLSADAVAGLRRWRPSDPRAWTRADPALARALDWPARDAPDAWRTRLEGGWRALGVTPAADPASGDPLPSPAGGTVDPHGGGEPGAASAIPDPFDDPLLAATWREALGALDALVAPGGRVGRQEVWATLRDALRSESVRDDEGASRDALACGRSRRSPTPACRTCCCSAPSTAPCRSRPPTTRCWASLTAPRWRPPAFPCGARATSPAARPCASGARGARRPSVCGSACPPRPAATPAFPAPSWRGSAWSRRRSASRRRRPRRPSGRPPCAPWTRSRTPSTPCSLTPDAPTRRRWRGRPTRAGARTTASSASASTPTRAAGRPPN